MRRGDCGEYRQAAEAVTKEQINKKGAGIASCPQPPRTDFNWLLTTKDEAAFSNDEIGLMEIGGLDAGQGNRVRGRELDHS